MIHSFDRNHELNCFPFHKPEQMEFSYGNAPHGVISSIAQVFSTTASRSQRSGHGAVRNMSTCFRHSPV